MSASIGKPRTGAANLAAWSLLVGATLVALLLSEGIVRLVENTRTEEKWRTVEGGPLHAFDPLLGWSPRPDATFRIRTTEFDVEVRTNRFGMRGPAGLDGACRVAVVGDSFVAGYQVGLDSLFWRVAARESGCAVVGLGVEGHSTDQELLHLERRLEDLRPTLVVLAFYQNDVWCNTRTECELESKPVFRLPDLDLVPPAGKADALLGLKRRMMRHSRLFRLVRSAVKGDLAYPHSYLTQAPLADEFRVLRRPYDPETAEAWAVTEALILRARASARAAGAGFILLHVPLRASLDPGEWAAAVRAQKLDARWRPDAVARHLEGFCGERELRCLFPYEALSRGSAPYFRRDAHWTAEGHRIVGRLLGDALREVAPIPSGHLHGAGR